MEVRSDWESLAPEVLAMVLQRVQASCGEHGEGRRLVAVAEVCRSWRQLVLQQEAVNMAQSICSSSPLIRFPAAIRRQAAVDCPLQCVLKKRGNSFSFFQTFQSSEGVKEEYFLLGARKRYMPSCASFELGTDSRILQAKDRASGNSVLASVRSNFSRSEFVIGDREAPESGTSSPLCVKYSEEVMAGMRQRMLSCSLKAASRTSKSSSPKTSRASDSPARASAATRRSFFPLSCLFTTRRQIRRVHSTLEDEREQSRGRNDGVLHEKRLVFEDHQETSEPTGIRTESPGSLSLKSKRPEWNQEHSCWSLDFKGRATMASIHNFQLLFSSDSSDDASPDQKVVLQLGKVAKGIYQVDFCSPLSALEAFSICLTSFATNVGLEP